MSYVAWEACLGNWRVTLVTPLVWPAEQATILCPVMYIIISFFLYIRCPRMKFIYTFGAIILELGIYSKIIQILRLNSLLVSFEMID